MAETASDFRVKDRASVRAAGSVMNGGISGKKERRCEIREEGSKVTGLKPFPQTSASLACEVKTTQF